MLGEDNELVTIDWLPGPPFQMTMGQFRQILREAEGTRHYPGVHTEEPCQTDEGDADGS